MPTLQDLHFFTNDPKGWNNWVQSGSNRFAYLPGGELSQYFFSEINFKNAYLKDTQLCGANLSRADLRGANLAGADLKEANLVGANLDGAYFCGANLTGADLAEASMNGTNFSDARMDQVRLTGVACSNTVFFNSSMRYIQGENLRLHHGNLDNTDLTGSVLHGSEFSSVNARNALFTATQAQNIDVKLSNMSYANFDKADWTESSLQMSTFFNASMCGINLKSASIHKVDLSYADLRKAQINKSHIANSRFNRAAFWQSNRKGWEIVDVHCNEAYWDKECTEVIYYSPGEFQKFLTSVPIINLMVQLSISQVGYRLQVILDHLKSHFKNVDLEIRAMYELDGSSSSIAVAILDDGGCHPLDLASQMLVVASELTDIQ